MNSDVGIIVLELICIAAFLLFFIAFGGWLAHLLILYIGWDKSDKRLTFGQWVILYDIEDKKHKKP